MAKLCHEQRQYRNMELVHSEYLIGSVFSNRCGFVMHISSFIYSHSIYCSFLYNLFIVRRLYLFLEDDKLRQLVYVYYLCIQTNRRN